MTIMTENIASSRILSGRGLRILFSMKRGIHVTADPPRTIRKPTLLIMGMKYWMMGGLSLTRTLNRDRRISARTSSTTQDATMSWPTGVSSIFPDFSAEAATPKLVGLKLAPTASALLTLEFPLAIPSPIPTKSGSAVPVRPIASARVPVSLNCATSNSTPASNSSMMRPISPTRTRASGKGTKSARGGPRRKPTKISPTRAGIPSLAVKIPAAVAMMRNSRMA
mmetsp:Transcript_37896/g.91412  ORF Transcript_37896/g.91412 Transcript_37896/m.91412 type:complete len:224 (-) Transcript_37896:820-1491(-)